MRFRRLFPLSTRRLPKRLQVRLFSSPDSALFALTSVRRRSNYVNVTYIYIGVTHAPGREARRYRQTGVDRADGCLFHHLVAHRLGHFGFCNRERTHGMRLSWTYELARAPR